MAGARFPDALSLVQRSTAQRPEGNYGKIAAINTHSLLNSDVNNRTKPNQTKVKAGRGFDLV